MRTTRTTIAFAQPFRLKSIDETFPPGRYDLETDEEPVERSDHIGYRRVRTLLLVRTSGHIRTIEVKPHELDQAIEADAAR